MPVAAFGFTAMQFTILILTMAQNSGYALLRRYSQGVLKEHTISSTVSPQVFFSSSRSQS